MSTDRNMVGGEHTAPVNWEEVHRRMAMAWGRFEEGITQTTEQKSALLRARAKLLAQEPTSTDAMAAAIEVVEFRLANETYAIESHYVQAVFPLKGITPLPCTPPFVLGIINVRGQILSIVNLKQIFSVLEVEATDPQTVVILHAGQMVFGILVEAVLGIRRLAGDAWQPTATPFRARRNEFFKGITGEQVMIVDGGKLLSHPGLIVQDMEIV